MQRLQPNQQRLSKRGSIQSAKRLLFSQNSYSSATGDISLLGDQEDPAQQIIAIDQKLSSGWYHRAFCWMWLCLILTSLTLLPAFFNIVESLSGQFIFSDVLLFILSLCCICMQFVAEITALVRKSLAWAIIAIVFFVVAFGAYIAIEITAYNDYIDAIAGSQFPSEDQTYDGLYITFKHIFVVFVGILLGLQLLVHIPFSVLIYKNLKKRATLKLKMSLETVWI